MPLSPQEFILFDECKYKVRIFRPEDRDIVAPWIRPERSKTGHIPGDDITIDDLMNWSDAELIAGFSGRFTLICHDIDLGMDLWFNALDFVPGHRLKCVRRMGLAKNPQCEAAAQHRMGNPDYVPNVLAPESFWMTSSSGSGATFKPNPDTMLFTLPLLIWLFHHSPISDAVENLVISYPLGPESGRPTNSGLSGPNDIWSNSYGKNVMFMPNEEWGTDIMPKNTIPSRYPSQEDFPFMYKGWTWPENKTVSYQEFFKETTTESFYPMTYPQLLQKYA